MHVKENAKNRILLVREGIYEIFDLNNVFYIESSSTKVIFHTTLGEFTSSETLSTLESKLKSMNFYRVHRSYLVNINQIKKVKLVGDRLYGIEFYNSSKMAYISRNRFKKFISVLEKEYLTVKKSLAR